jgi:hypothetical protein
MEWKRSGIGKERARLKVGLWRRHGEERERSKCGEIGGGERVKPYEMPFPVKKTVRCSSLICGK